VLLQNIFSSASVFGCRAGIAGSIPVRQPAAWAERNSDGPSGLGSYNMQPWVGVSSTTHRTITGVMRHPSSLPLAALSSPYPVSELADLAKQIEAIRNRNPASIATF
jgi:hypothetical protein